MFISADCYYETYIKGKTKEEIAAEVDRLSHDIAALEEAGEEDLTEIRKIFPDFPSVKEQIELKKEYLSRASEALANL